MQNTYKSSGKVSPLSFLYFAAFLVIEGLIITLIYANTNNGNLRFFTVAFNYANLVVSGLILSYFYANKVIVKLGRVRNPLGAILYAFIPLTLIFLLQWLYLIIGLDPETDFSLKNLTILAGSLSEVSLTYDGQKYTLERGDRVLGYLRLGWVVKQFLWVLILSVLAARNSYFMSIIPYCEEHGKWYELKDKVEFSYIDNAWEIKEGLDKLNISVLSGLHQENNISSMDHSRWDLYSCGEDEHYLSVINVRVYVRNKKKPKTKEHEVVEFLKINSQMKEAILQRELDSVLA